MTSNMRRLLNIFVSREAVRYIGVGLVTPLTALLSIIVLQRMAEAIQHGATFRWLCIWFLLQIIGKVSNSVGYYCKTRWVLNACQRYAMAVCSRLSGQSSLFASQNEKGKTTSMLTSVGPDILTNSINYFSSLIFNLINTISVFVGITIFFDWKFSILFTISSVLVLLLTWRMHDKNRRLSKATEQSKKHYYSHLINFWDNIVPGTEYYKEAWITSLAHRYSYQRKVTLARDAYMTILDLIMYAVSVMPAIIYLLLKVESASDTNIVISTLLLTPTIYGALASLQGVFFLIGQAGFAHGQLSTLADSLKSVVKIDLKDRINFHSVKVNGEPLISIVEFLAPNFLTDKRKRYTITGDNGSGKTSLLLYLKETLGEHAAYLPPNSLTLVSSISKKNASSGNSHFLQLSGLLQNSAEKVLLLDEWDNHMDDCNRSKANTRLDKFVAEGGTVVEVLHTKQ